MAVAVAAAGGGRRNIEPEMVSECRANGASKTRIGHDLRHPANLNGGDPTQIDCPDLVD